MDNNPDKQPNDLSEELKLSPDNQTPDVNSTPSFDQEPATGGATPDSTPTDPSPVVDVPKENPVPTESPFGPPIENLGTQPNFGSNPSESPVVNNASPNDPLPTKPISDITTKPPAPNVIEPHSPAETPAAAAPVPSETSSQVVDEKKAAKEGKKTFIKLPKQKKNRKGVYALLIALVVIIGGLVGGYLFLKTSADSAADNYTAKAKTYLDEVYSAVSVQADGDPADIKTQIDGISKPILEKPLLSDVSFVSSSHSEAATLNNQVISQVSALTTTLMSLSDAYSFGSEYDTLTKEATTISGTVNSDSTKAETLKMLADYQVVLEKMQTLVKGAALPDTLSEAQTNLSSALTDEITATKDQITAFTADKDTEYNQAKTELATAAAKEATALETIKEYNLTIPSQVNSAAETLKTFIASVKTN